MLIEKYNYYWYRLLWRYAGLFPNRALPVHLDLELTNRCNLACIMCPHSEVKKSFNVGDMPLTMAKDLINVGAGKIKSVKFNWRGEPVLYKDLPKMITYAKKKRYIETMINTNLNYSRRLLEQIVAAGINTIIISIDSFNREIYSQIRVGGNLDLVLENLEYLKDMINSKKYKFRIIVQARRQELNKDEIFPGWVSVKPATRRTGDDRYVLGGQESIGRRNCLMPLRRLLVSWEGKVFGCCADWNELNSVGEVTGRDAQTLPGIWEGRKISKMRRDLTNGKAFRYEPCKSCFSRESYKWKRLG